MQPNFFYGMTIAKYEPICVETELRHIQIQTSILRIHHPYLSARQQEHAANQECTSLYSHSTLYHLDSNTPPAYWLIETWLVAISKERTNIMNSLRAGKPVGLPGSEWGEVSARLQPRIKARGATRLAHP